MALPLLAAALALLFTLTARKQPAPPLVHKGTLVVFPFATREPRLEPVGALIAKLMVASLASAELEVRPFEHGEAHTVAEAQEALQGQQIDLFVHGTILEVGSKILVQASLHDVRGERLARGRAEGAPAEASKLAERVIAELRPGLSGWAARVTNSVP